MFKVLFGSALVVLVIFGFWFLSTLGGSPAGVSQTPVSTSTIDLYAMSASSEASSSPIAQPSAAASSTVINNSKKIMQATLHTTMGDITIELLVADAPNTTANFIKLAQSGFYDGTKFHRVIAGFMDQGGDPLTKDDSMMARWGTGGPGYQFADENASARNDLGVVSMANSGPNTNGSQFFINAADNNFLDGKYSVFGRVTAGLDVVKAINATPTDSSDRPLKPVVIQSITLK